MINDKEDDFDDLLDKFIVSRDLELELLKDNLKKISRFARIYNSGEVEITNENLTQKDKVFIIILARYLAYKINELKNQEFVKNISESTKIGEIARMLGKTPKQVSARLSDLEKEKYIKKMGKGNYTIISLNRALEYLNKLIKREMNGND